MLTATRQRRWRASSTHIFFLLKKAIIFISVPVYGSNLCGSAIVINPDITNKHLKEKKATQPSTRHPVTICFTFYPNFNYVLHLCWQQRDLLHREVSYVKARKTCSMSKGKRGGGVNCCNPVKLYFPFCPEVIEWQQLKVWGGDTCKASMRKCKKDGNTSRVTHHVKKTNLKNCSDS